MHLRRFLLLLFAALALNQSPPALAQSLAKTFTLTAASQSACIGTSGLPTVGIAVSGTFSLTLQPQTSINGSTAQNSQVTPSTSTTAQSTITAAGNYVAGVGGFDTFCLNVSAYVSGTVTIRLNPSAALNAGLLAPPPVSNLAFSGITSGTNTTMAALCGTGCSLGTTGTGSVQATTLSGATFASPGAIGATTPGTGVFTTTTSGTAGTTAGFVDLGEGVTTAAMTPQSSASCTNVTNMTWLIAASKRFSLHCTIPMTFATSATVAFCIGGPGTPTSHTINAVGSIGAAGVYDDISVINSTTYGTKTSASGAVGASTQVVLLDATISNGATASGTALTLQTAANGTNTITVLGDADCHLLQTN